MPCVIAGGVVLNPAKAIEEIDDLAARNVEVADNLMLSDRAHVIFPWHFAEDRALDRNTSDGENIGTTGRGIGPCYRDKVGRSYRRPPGRHVSRHLPRSSRAHHRREESVAQSDGPRG